MPWTKAKLTNDFNIMIAAEKEHLDRAVASGHTVSARQHASAVIQLEQELNKIRKE